MAISLDLFGRRRRLEGFRLGALLALTAGPQPLGLGSADWAAHARIRTGIGVSVIVKKLTWDEIKGFPESHGRTEIVDGELVVSPTPSGPHQRICTLLGIRIGNFVLEQNLGEFYSSPYHVVLTEHVNYEPDLCFIRKERLHIAQETFIDGPPDLAIEVISESNRTHDTVVKFRDYARYGIQEYWLVDRRAGRISTWRLAGSEYVLLSQSGRGDRVISRVLEGLELDPAQVLD